jgi:hypothetical protein
MIDNETTVATKASARRWGAAAALVAAGLAGGIVLAGTASANATTTPSPSATSSSSSSDSTTDNSTRGTMGTRPSLPEPKSDQSKPQRSDEKLLTGATADKVTAAALAKYPGATIQRVETDSHGVYEAHVVTSDGSRVIVQVGSDFSVTGTQQHRHGGPGMGRAGGVDRDRHDNDGRGAGIAPSGAPATTSSSSHTA